ncbi:hypothetical protein OG762_09900 [Streptomyces sp. NBC_01136]|uniref:hypothetical protein n=1 Tax=unclassified Streptomyces TaxID=2593676 RepID=UPI0032533680|nr:hypothetical protein OG762_09900 [Streptomyces sp. NBC_01136]
MALAPVPPLTDALLGCPADVLSGRRAPQLLAPAVRRRTSLALLPVAAALLLTAAHEARPAAYGDRLTHHARVAHGHASLPPLRATRTTVEAYDEATGRSRWTCAREGRRPPAVVPARGDGSAVRWHRALPGAARWLAERGPSGVLRPLGAHMPAVVTARRVAAYRIADGDLRWTLPVRRGCAFDPERAVRHGAALLIAQPCAATDSWTTGLVAVDDLGGITPHRKPLGNERRGERHSAEHPHSGKVVARPR